MLCSLDITDDILDYSGIMGLQARRTDNLQGEEELVWDLEGKNPEFSVFEFDQVLEATSNFSEVNKLGEGGFGAVYKVKIQNT